MRKQFQISIPEPCNVPWDSMQPVDEQKRHCSSCEKIIYDFTKMSDAELVKFLSTNKKACGQFADYQLNRNLIPAEPVRTKKWPLALLLTSVLFSLKSQANPVRTEKITQEQTESNNLSLPNETELLNGNQRIIEGTVVDGFTNDSLHGAIVWIEANGQKFQNTTDSAGKFRIAIPKSFITDSTLLEIRHTGYGSLSIHLNTIGENAVLRMEAVLQDAVVIVSGRTESVVGQIRGYAGVPAIIDQPEKVKHSRFRHFFYRLFHPRAKMRN